ncbi:MAG: hypothetical protein EA384_02505 [Spirochaetaceae bacterium]|nr:MAG: hypothetical protein EA384_02505 [Spirochaetaceae bacterium]
MLHVFHSKLLFFGLASVLAGALLLLGTLGYLPAAGIFWPTVLILLGLWMLYASFFRNARESHVFSGFFLTLGGSLVLLMNTILTRFALERIWPVFMTIAGVSLFGYAMKKAPVHRVALTIPACAIIVLSLVFLFFSLGLADVEFIQFVALWWPSLFVLVGLVLIALYLRGR